MNVRRPRYIPGDYLMVCDRCGFTIRSSEARKTWDGLMVCAADYESRHPQDFVRGQEDKQSVPEPRPRPEDVFITTPVTSEDL